MLVSSSTTRTRCLDVLFMSAPLQHLLEAVVLRIEAAQNLHPLLFVQKDVEEGVVDPNLAVVFDESQFSESIHKKTHS